jgi:hypothetical protein
VQEEWWALFRERQGDTENAPAVCFSMALGTVVYTGCRYHRSCVLPREASSRAGAVELFTCHTLSTSAAGAATPAVMFCRRSSFARAALTAARLRGRQSVPSVPHSPLALSSVSTTMGTSLSATACRFSAWYCSAVRSSDSCRAKHACSARHQQSGTRHAPKL